MKYENIPNLSHMKNIFLWYDNNMMTHFCNYLFHISLYNLHRDTYQSHIESCISFLDFNILYKIEYQIWCNTHKVWNKRFYRNSDMILKGQKESTLGKEYSSNCKFLFI